MDESDQIITRYLLGELSESEQTGLEEKYFTDPQVFDQVLKIESELVDGYARGQLSAQMRERFEQSYMAHPRLRERVKFAKALATRLDQTEASGAAAGQPILAASLWQRLIVSLRGQRPTLRFSIALATLLIMLGGVWFFFESRRVQRELAQTQSAQAEQERRQRETAQQSADEQRRAVELAANQERPEQTTQQQMPQPTPTPRSPSAPTSVSLTLTLGGVQGNDAGQMPTLIIPSGTAQARLQLNLKENDYPSYRVSLQSAGGAEIYSRQGLKPGVTKSGASFVLTVPAQKLTTGDYILTLAGVSQNGEVDTLGKSLFRVEKR